MKPFIMPGFIYLVCALFIPYFKGTARKVYMLTVASIVLLLVLLMPNPEQPISLFNYDFLGFTITFLKLDRLSWFLAMSFALTGLLGLIYSLNGEDTTEFMLIFVYIGASIGAVFAGDFLTLYIFWEIMALAPTFMVWLTKEEESVQAAWRYLIMHTIGGLFLLAGIMLNYNATGSMEVGVIEVGGIGWLMALVGVGLNAGFIPLHTWLPDTYPRGTYISSIFLCVYTTKTAVYLLTRTFSGHMAVAWMGGIMAVYAVSYALLQNNARKLLSYHVISQVGYMVAGIGMGTVLGIDGGIAHLYNNILYKGLLFMCMGSVLYMTGKVYLTDMGGLAKKMPVTTITCVIAALSISGVPFFNGYISKSLLLTAAHDHEGLLFLLELAAVGTFLSFCKLCYFAFFRPNPEMEKSNVTDPPIHMKIPMIIVAGLCILYGVYPPALTSVLPIYIEHHFYGLGHTLGTAMLLGTTALVFWYGRKVYSPHKVIMLDFDFFYKIGAKWFMTLIIVPFGGVGDIADKLVTNITVKLWQPISYSKSLINYLEDRFLVGYSSFVDRMQNSVGPGYLNLCQFFKEFDAKIVDDLVNDVPRKIDGVGEASRSLQNGFIRQYAFMIIVGTLILTSLGLYLYKQGAI